MYSHAAARSRMLAPLSSIEGPMRAELYRRSRLPLVPGYEELDMIRVTTALALIGALHSVVAPNAALRAQEPQATSLERRVDSLFAPYTQGATPGVAIAV